MEPTDNVHVPAVPATSESQPEDKTDLVSFVSSATANIHEASGKRSKKRTVNPKKYVHAAARRRLKRREQESGGEGTTSESATKSISAELSPSPSGPSSKKHIPAEIDRYHAVESWLLHDMLDLNLPGPTAPQTTGLPTTNYFTSSLPPMHHSYSDPSLYTLPTSTAATIDDDIDTVVSVLSEGRLTPPAEYGYYDDRRLTPPVQCGSPVTMPALYLPQAMIDPPTLHMPPIFSFQSSALYDLEMDLIGLNSGKAPEMIDATSVFEPTFESQVAVDGEAHNSEEQSQCPTPKPVIMSINEFSPSSCQTIEHLHIAGSKPTFIDSGTEEKAPEIEEILLPSPSQSTYPINRSPHFSEAEKRAGVPFLHHAILECDHHIREYTIQDHDITFRIPEGAIPPGKKIQFEIAVAMYGPFKFEKDTQPISPILWLCFEEGVTLNKPFHVILPHFLTGLTCDKAQYHQVVFTKASHSKYSIEDGQMKFSFQPCDSEPYFASCGGRNFGVLVTNHTCFYCLQANKTPKLAMDAGYCLARIEHFNQRHMEVTFTAVYCLRTCLRAMEEQFPYEEGYRITDYKDFKFKENTEPHVRVVPTCECDKIDVTLNPTSSKIRAGDINFWRKDVDAMQLRHEKKMYPPRVKMTVGMKNPDDFDIYKLSVKIEGCSEEDQLDIQLFFPPSTPPSVSGSASSSISQGECQSSKIKVQEQPKLKDVFKELLPLSADWKTIGTLLGLPEDLIKRTKADEDKARDQLREMLSEWLNQVDPRPTWTALAEAVEPVDKVKAQDIKTKYIDI